MLRNELALNYSVTIIIQTVACYLQVLAVTVRIYRIIRIDQGQGELNSKVVTIFCLILDRSIPQPALWETTRT